MELTPERIRSLVEEVTQELSRQGVISSSQMRARLAAETAPSSGAERNVGRAHGSRVAGGEVSPKSILEYGNVSGRPGSYGGGFEPIPDRVCLKGRGYRCTNCRTSLYRKIDIRSYRKRDIVCQNSPRYRSGYFQAYQCPGHP